MSWFRTCDGSGADPMYMSFIAALGVPAVVHNIVTCEALHFTGHVESIG